MYIRFQFHFLSCVANIAVHLFCFRTLVATIWTRIRRNKPPAILLKFRVIKTKRKDDTICSYLWLTICVPNSFSHVACIKCIWAEQVFFQKNLMTTKNILPLTIFELQGKVISWCNKNVTFSFYQFVKSKSGMLRRNISATLILFNFCLFEIFWKKVT